MSKSRLSHDPAADAARLRAKKFREETLSGDLYAMYSLKTILANMRTLEGEERIYWGWVRYSWCYPLCLPYAVQIDADGNPIWDSRTSRWLPMSQKLLAKIMGLDQGYLCRATGALVQQGRLAVDDGAVQIVLEPEPIAPEEGGRTNGEGGYDCTVIWGIPLGGLPTLPKPVLNTLHRTFEAAQVPLGERRLELAKPLFETRRKLLDEWNQLRETEALTYAGQLAQLQLDLGVDPEAEVRSAGRNGNGNGSHPTSEPAADTASETDKDVRNEELYEAGVGRGAMAKLPRPRKLPGKNVATEPNGEPSMANVLLLGLGERGLVIELAFAERLARMRCRLATVRSSSSRFSTMTARLTRACISHSPQPCCLPSPSPWPPSTATGRRRSCRPASARPRLARNSELASLQSGRPPIVMKQLRRRIERSTPSS